MKTCKDCYHYEACHRKDREIPANTCRTFKDKSLAIDLPCKVGDTVYYLNTRPHIVFRRNEIYEAKVIRIVVISLGVALVIQTRGEYGCCETPDIKDWDKTVFLTRESAEQALKELSNEQ